MPQNLKQPSSGNKITLLLRTLLEIFDLCARNFVDFTGSKAAAAGAAGESGRGALEGGFVVYVF